MKEPSGHKYPGNSHPDPGVTSQLFKNSSQENQALPSPPQEYLRPPGRAGEQNSHLELSRSRQRSAQGWTRLKDFPPEIPRPGDPNPGAAPEGFSRGLGSRPGAGIQGRAVSFQDFATRKQQKLRIGAGSGSGPGGSGSGGLGSQFPNFYLKKGLGTPSGIPIPSFPSQKGVGNPGWDPDSQISHPKKGPCRSLKSPVPEGSRPHLSPDFGVAVPCLHFRSCWELQEKQGGGWQVLVPIPVPFPVPPYPFPPHFRMAALCLIPAGNSEGWGLATPFSCPHPCPCPFSCPYPHPCPPNPFSHSRLPSPCPIPTGNSAGSSSPPLTLSLS